MGSTGVVQLSYWNNGSIIQWAADVEHFLLRALNRRRRSSGGLLPND